MWNRNTQGRSREEKKCFIWWSHVWNHKQNRNYRKTKRNRGCQPSFWLQTRGKKNVLVHTKKALRQQKEDQQPYSGSTHSFYFGPHRFAWNCWWSRGRHSWIRYVGCLLKQVKVSSMQSIALVKFGKPDIAANCILIFAGSPAVSGNPMYLRL